MIVNFSKDEVDQIRDWGLKRSENTAKVRVRGHQIQVPKAGAQSDIEGVAGEYAVLKVLSLRFNPGWTPVRTGPDAGIDLMLRDCRSIAVKFRRYMSKPGIWPALRPGEVARQDVVLPRFATHTKYLMCDIGILTQEVPNSFGRSVEVVGWISKEEFNDPKVHHLYDFGRGLGPQPAVYDYQLHPIKEFK